MTATSGDWLKRVVPATTLAIVIGLSACSGDSEPAEKAASSAAPTPTVDQAALDQQALEKLTTDFWAVRTSSQNTSNASPEQFSAVLAPGVAETEIGTLNDYRKLKVVRKGAPQITDVEVVATGDTGQILACVNEDEWTAEADGEPFELPKRGPKAWGATTERNGDGWIIAAFLSGDDSKAKKRC